MNARLTCTIVVASALVLLACAGNSNGSPSITMQPNQQIAPPVGLMLVGLDADRDTVISVEEISTGAQVMFEASDTDGSGNLTAIELAQWSQKQLGNSQAVPGMMRFDRDHNNRVSADEFDTTIKAIVNRFDRDQDGALSRAELLMTIDAPDMGAMRAEMQSQMRQRAQQMCRQAGR